jgi:hypothetical protein
MQAPHDSQQYRRARTKTFRIRQQETCGGISRDSLAGIGRLTGKAGVDLAISGSGASNFATDLATANTEGDPVLAMRRGETGGPAEADASERGYGEPVHAGCHVGGRLTKKGGVSGCFARRTVWPGPDVAASPAGSACQILAGRSRLSVAQITLLTTRLLIRRHGEQAAPAGGVT